jgi:hypothetical protein
MHKKYIHMNRLIYLLVLFLSLNSLGFSQTVDRVEGSPFPASTAVDHLYFTHRDMSESEQYAVGFTDTLFKSTRRVYSM